METDVSLGWLIFYGVFLIAAPILATELDIKRYRFVRLMHPRTTFFSAIFMIIFYGGLAYAINRLGAPRTPGVIIFVASAIIWGAYGNWRTRRMWPATRD